MTDDLTQLDDLEKQVLTPRSAEILQSKIDRALIQCRQHALIFKAISDHGVEHARELHGAYTDFILRKAAAAIFLQNVIGLHDQARALIAQGRAQEAYRGSSDTLDAWPATIAPHHAQSAAPSVIGEVDAAAGGELSPDFRCEACDKQLHEGEKHWTVNVNLEAFEAGAITVHESNCYRLYCEACGNARNFDDDTDSLGAA